MSFLARLRLLGLLGRGFRGRLKRVDRTPRLHCEQLEDRIVPQINSQDYITQVYTDLLHRTVDSGGLSFWSSQIDNGESLDQVLLSMESSAEFHDDEVEQFYTTFLNRNADLDLASMAFWDGELNSESVQQVEASIVGSQEFFNDAGDTDAGFLEALYEDALDGPVDPAGNAFWTGELERGMSRTEVAYDVLTSPEADTVLVESYYQEYLHRAGDSAGVSFWVGQLESGASEQDVIAGFLSSTEYSTRIPNAPIITSPASAVTTAATTYTITGIAESGSLVQVYNSSGSEVANEQLVGSQTDFSISVPLTSDAANNFTVTDINAYANESAPATVPTITQSATVVNITTPAEQKSYEGASATLDIVATDTKDLTLTYSATGLPDGLTINATTGVISGTVDSGDSTGSPYSVTVTATDSAGNTNSATFTWLVDLEGNLTLTAPANEISFEGNDLTTSNDITATATENNTNALTYTATGLPAGLSIDSTTGAITGLINPGDGSTTPYTVDLSVTDGLNTATATFTWTVYKITAIPEQENDTGTSASVQVTTNDTNAVTYSASGLPAGLSINSAGLISGTITAAAGTYTATVTVTDTASGASGIDTFTWLVYAAGDPVLIPPATQQNIVGSKVSDVAVTVGGTPASPVTYTATNLPAGLSISKTTGVISGTVDSTDSASSPYTVTVTATDTAGTSTASFNWVVLTESTSLPYSLTNPNWVTLASGVRYWNQQLGTGTTAEAGDGVTVNYIGYLADGTIFNQFTTDFTATLSTSSLIVGWVDGVPGMKVGGTRLLDIPASLAYGDSPPSGIPDNAELVFLITLTAVTSPITVNSPGEQENYEGAPISLQMSGSDTSTTSPLPPLTYTATGLPTGLSISSSGLISGTIDSDDSNTSPYTVTVNATDGTYTGSVTFTWLVDISGDLTFTTTPATQTNFEGNTVTGVDAVATQDNSNPLTYTASGLPDGLSIAPSTGVISGTVDTGDSGTYTVNLTATDGLNTANTSFTWNVYSVTAVPEQESFEGASPSVQVSTNDPNAVTYSALGLPDDLSIDSTGLISGTIDTGDSTSSPYTVTVTVTDPSGASGTTTFTWLVDLSGNLAFTTTPATQTNFEGNTVTGVDAVAAQDNSNPLTYSATDLPVGLSIDPSTGVISGTIDTGDSGTYTVELTATDGLNTANTSFTWNVYSVTPVAEQENFTNTTPSVPITTNDPNAVTYSATGLPTGLSIDPSTGIIGGAFNLSDATKSPYTVTVTVTDTTADVSGTTTFTWLVDTSGALVFTTTPATQTNFEGNTVTDVAVAASQGNNNPLTYSAGGLPNGLSIDASTGVISGAIDTGDNGTYTVSLSITDGLNTANTSFTWNVYSITAANQVSFEGDTPSVQVSSSDPNTGTTTYTASGLPTGLTMSSSGLITGTVNSGDASIVPYTVTVTATDSTTGASGSTTFTWTVYSVAAVPTQNNFEGDTPSVQVSTSDTNAVSYSISGQPPTLSIGASGLISGTIQSGASMNSPYTVIVTVTDTATGASGTTTFTWNVSA